LAYRFQKLGFQFYRNDVDILYDRFLQVADHKKVVEDEDLSELANVYQKAEGRMAKA
jgi:2-isopropylmalate synthase